jgi:hypothetical protein
MTEQSSRDQWTSPALHPAGTDWTDAQRPAEDATASQTAVYESADHQSTSDEHRVGGTPVNEPGALQRAAEHAGEESPADGDGLDAVDASVPADHLNRHPTDPEEPSPVTSAPDAELTAEPHTSIVDRGDVDSPDPAGAADIPNGATGAEGYPDDAKRAAQEPEAAAEPDHPAEEADTGQPVHDIEENATATDQPVALDVNGSGELLPSDVLREPVLALLDAETTDRFQARWQRLQLLFIDDPRTVTGQAGALVDEVVTALHEAVDRRRLALEDWQSGDRVDAHTGDTERLRVAVRRYRDFLGQLLGQ